MAEHGFLSTLGRMLRIECEKPTDIGREISSLSDKDKMDLYSYAIAQGVEIDKPKLKNDGTYTE